MADASSTRTQRATALEEKRRRLEDLKKRRTQRVDDPTNKPAVAANLDEYIDGLLSVAAPPVSVGGSEETVVVATTPVSSAQQQQQTTAAGGETPPAASSSSEPPATAELPPSRPIVETFTIATQTEMEDVMEYNTADVQEEEDGDKALLMTTTIGDDSALQQQQQQHIPKHLDSHQIQQTIISMSSPADFASFITTASKKVERLLGASRISDDDDLLIDYVGASTETSSSNNSNNNNERQFVSSKQIYECPKWTHTREVTDMDWSNLHRDVLLATYHMPNSSSNSSNSNYSNNHHKKGSTAISAVSSKQSLSASMMTPRSGELQSDGLVLLWNLTMLQRPEHIFTCGSPVLCGTFHSLVEPTLVLGGCESGQLVIWDTRAGRLPVQKSALSSVVGASSKGHAHPITTMKSMEGGLGLVTSSSDGRVNFWSLANLREPADSIQVSDSVSCLTVAPESETLLVGDEMGSLYSIQSASSSSSTTSGSSSAPTTTTGSRTSSRKQVRKLETVDANNGNNVGHYGMVTSLSSKILKQNASTRTAALSKGFLRGSGGLVLSCGVDWTVKLWAPAYNDTPLLSMVSHSYDYMSDVQWSPTHPSLFATASSNGSMALWNLATSLEEPITGNTGLVIDSDAMSGRGLNKLQWAADGRRIAVASGDQVHVVTLTEEVSRPKGDEDVKLMNQLMARGLIGRQ